MRLNKSIFAKIVTLICLLLIPILLLYSYSYKVSVDVVKQEIQASSLNRLSFFMSQLESSVDQLAKFSIIVSRDPGIKAYMEQRGRYSQFEKFKAQIDIVQKLNLQVVSSNWDSQLVLFTPDTKEIVSSDFSIIEDDFSYLRTQESQKWVYKNSRAGKVIPEYFSRFSYSNQETSDYMVEVRFSKENIIRMLDQLKYGDQGDPFFFQPANDPIVNSNPNLGLIESISQALKDIHLQDQNSIIVTVNNNKYVVNYNKSDSLGWYLVDYQLLEQTITPIMKSRNLFYISLGLLLVLSIIATFLLYKHVQIPIRKLAKGVKSIRNGNLSVRIQNHNHNDFDYLFDSFNDMAAEIQHLIETVYKEKLRLREATVKQLQSQINPHFLYNCLFYIKSVANMGDTDAVMAMALNLGDYFRYTTRVETTMVTVEEEITMLRNYLSIQHLRIDRFHYEIEIPDEILHMCIPRLLLQPIVENAIIHGIERSKDFGLIEIRGVLNDDVCQILIEDNGEGMSESEIQDLQAKLNAPMDDEMGCGLWNIHQRLCYQFKGQSGLRFQKADSGGLLVVVTWELNK
ncbi:sensor histidine kinase [Paenibacillus hamazuiensis]|uniref:sensor histidine kinase n=1 Tax=Paenibacillus hamazuiensis TaxID=2936508 RepID=UPI0020107092|nr:histidine kinase [Paenibacillus hamazuiensis]